MRCAETYQGNSFPRFRGACCVLEAPHGGERHRADVEGGPLSWWTPKEKEAVRARKRARKKEDEP